MYELRPQQKLNTIARHEIHDGILFDFYPRLPHTLETLLKYVYMWADAYQEKMLVSSAYGRSAKALVF